MHTRQRSILECIPQLHVTHPEIGAVLQPEITVAPGIARIAIDDTGEITIGVLLVRFRSRFKPDVVGVVGKQPPLAYTAIQSIAADLAVPKHREINVLPR